MAAVFMEQQVQLLSKWLLIALLFIACVRGSSPAKTKWYDANDIKLQNIAGVHKMGGNAFTGTVFQLAENRRDTVAVASFVNGLEDGEWRSYYSNRQLKERRYFSKGKKVGVFEGWWANGKQRLLYHFKDDEYDGNCKEWDVKGLLVNNMNYKRGHEDGLQQQFYESGKVKANYMMIEGRRYGLLGTKNCMNVSDSIFKR
jgi:antitoxin component YwqK of YwqJK toxin-antitoxin module